MSMWSERCLYFGVWDERHLGHYIYGPSGHREHPTSLPPFLDSRRLDGIYAPPLPEQPEGLAALHHLGDWTVLAFWDRSGDSRLNSNSAFIARGHLDFAMIVNVARDAFPTIWKRFPFQVIAWTSPA